MSNYIFKTERLGFREWCDSDIEPFIKLNQNPDVMRFFPNTLTADQTQSFIERIKKHFSNYGYGLWAVEELSSNNFIGFIGFQYTNFEADFTPCVEIGWRLDSKFWNRGFATEGAKAALQCGFNHLGFDNIYSFTAEINKPSLKVMRKIGMVKVGEFNHPKLDNTSPLLLHHLYKIEKGV